MRAARDTFSSLRKVSNNSELQQIVNLCSSTRLIAAFEQFHSVGAVPAFTTLDGQLNNTRSEKGENPSDLGTGALTGLRIEILCSRAASEIAPVLAAELFALCVVLWLVVRDSTWH